MKADNAYVCRIKAGDKINDFFLVKEKVLAFSQKGSPYLNLRLQDRTGEVDGKVWDNAREWEKVFQRGDIIRVQARALSYKNVLQLSIAEVERIDEEAVHLADFLPAAKRDIEEMYAELLTYVEGVASPHLRPLLDAFFGDENFAARFKKAPAAKGFHHVYMGGLLEHTLSVTGLIDDLCRHYEGLDRDLLIAGGLLHDMGKIDEFSYGRIIDYTDRGRLIGHIVMGVEMVDGVISTIPDFPEKLAMELRHLLLSHHGDLEYGSPKRPKTVEALIVHHADDLDAKLNAFREYISASPEDDSGWTPFHRLLDRYIYKG